MNIAFFDFDGTITKKDTLMEFTKYAVGGLRFYLGFFILLPAMVFFKLKLIPNYRAKEMFLGYFFKAWSVEKFQNLADKYAKNEIDKILREKALEKLNWHKENGHEVVVVSASIDMWLKAWCEKNHLKLICTKLEIKDKKITGKILGKNCHGIEKVNRIKEVYDLNNFETIYAYGDSSGDKQMLEMAHESYYKPFRD